MASHRGKHKLPSPKHPEASAIDAVQQSGAGWAGIRYFKPRDFTCRCEGLCGHPDVISQDLVTKLDKIQDLIGLPVTVIFGTRCEKLIGNPEAESAQLTLPRAGSATPPISAVLMRHSDLPF